MYIKVNPPSNEFQNTNFFNISRICAKNSTIVRLPKNPVLIQNLTLNFNKYEGTLSYQNFVSNNTSCALLNHELVEVKVDKI